MIGHCLDPHADHEPDYSGAQTIDDLVDVVSMSARRTTGTGWEEAAEVAERALKGERDPLVEYPLLHGIAAARGRTGDPGLRAAIRRIEEADA